MNVPRLRHLLTTLFLSCLFPVSGYGEMDVLFAPDTDIQTLLKDRIANSTQSINLTTASLGPGELTHALTEASARGVEVKIVIDYQSALQETSRVSLLKEEGLQIKAIKGNAGGQMNNNFAIFDNKLLATGSYSWTNQAAKHSNEDIVLIDDNSVIDSYRQEFERMFGTEDQLAWAAPERKPAKPGDRIQAAKGRVPSPKDIPFPKSAHGDREFIDVTIDELEALFGPPSTLSDKEKDAAWEQQYDGKYVQWNGVIAAKGFSHLDFHTLRLSSEFGREPEMTVTFKSKYYPVLQALKEGDVIAYTARLQKRNNFGTLFRLDNAGIIGILTKKAPGR
jgi:hypothetical protein